MPKVAIINQHTHNYGDDIAGLAVVDELRRQVSPELIDIFYIWHGEPVGRVAVDGDECRHHYLQDLSGRTDRRPQLAISVLLQLLTGRIWRRDLRVLTASAQAAEIVLVSPAGSNIGIYKDWTYLLVLATLVKKRVRPVFHLNTIGPSGSKLFDWVARQVLRRCQIYVREQASHEWLSNLKIHSVLGVDSALLSRPPTPTPMVRRPIAVVPTGLANWHRDYKGRNDGDLWQGKLVTALEGVSTSSGLPIVMVPHLYGVQAEPELLAGLAGMLVNVGCDASVADVKSSRDYVQSLAEASVVVSMRYHGLVVGGLAGVPVVSLSYENKMKEAAGYLGLAKWSLDVKDFSADRLAERILDALQRRVEIESQLVARAPGLRDRAGRPIRDIKERLKILR